jgi:hypothetical protein
MQIQNQDRDRIYNIESVFYKRHVVDGIIFGYNIYGRTPTGKRKYFLAIYDTMDDAIQVCGEIKRLIEKSIETYSMPEPSDFDNYDIFEMLGGFDKYEKS